MVNSLKERIYLGFVRMFLKLGLLENKHGK